MQKVVRQVLVFSLVIAFGVAFGQQTYEGQTVNQIDEEGKKTGLWVILGKDQTKPGYQPDQVVEKGEYASGRKTGLWTLFYPSNTVKSEITYSNGRPRGPYKVYYENGQLEEDGNWRSNRNTGAFKRYYEDGQVAQDFNFSPGGKREGEQIYYYENGQVMIQGNWNGGKESGELKRWYDNGELKSVQYFDEGKSDPTKTKTYGDPEQLASADPEPIPQPTESGVKTTVVVNTQKEKPNVGRFDGNGKHTLYNKNKQVTQKGLFVNGKLKDGEIRRYNKDGILEKIEVYKNFGYVGDGVVTEEQ